MNRERVRDALASLGIGFIVYAAVHFITGLWHHPGIDALAMPGAVALSLPVVAGFWRWMGSTKTGEQ